jgi:prepilin-type N-terminal cleavage/methylation domain-containing protein
MASTSHRRSNHRQRGFTLVEVLLVLAVMSVFVGMAMPSVLRMFGQQKLTASAERVREAIALARVRAIQTGLIYEFCCEPNGTHYVVVPFEPDHSVSQNQNSSQAAATPPAPRASGFLPKGVVFSAEVLGNASVSNAAFGMPSLTSAALDGLPNASELAGISWSTPILFKPDGSANTDTEITISDTRSQQIRLRVRSLTGAVSMERLHVGKR